MKSLAQSNLSRGNALALLGAASLIADPLAATAQTAIPIRIAGSTTDPYMVPYYASELGYFTRAGLNVELATQPTVGAVVQAVAANAADVGQGDAIQLANAISHGIPLAIFAGGGLYRSTQPSIAHCVAQTSVYRNARDLQGQTVGVVTLNSLSAISILAWLSRNSIDPASVKLIEMPFPQMAPAIAKGTIAAAFLVEPFLSFSGIDLRILASTYDAIAPAFYLGCWFATRDWLTKNPDLARRLSAVIYDTAKWANAHRDDTATILARLAKLDLASAKKMIRTDYATSLDPRLIDPVLKEAYQYKLITTPATAQDLIMKRA